METKYRIIKTISGKEIINTGVYKCDEGLEKYLMKFGLKEIKWNKENEDWITNNINGGIEWLISNEFIEENKKAYDKNKAYFCYLKFIKSIGLLRRVGDKYAWVCLSRENTLFDSVLYPDINTAISNIADLNCVMTFDTAIEGIEYYQNKGIL